MNMFYYLFIRSPWVLVMALNNEGNIFPLKLSPYNKKKKKKKLLMFPFFFFTGGFFGAQGPDIRIKHRSLFSWAAKMYSVLEPRYGLSGLVLVNGFSTQPKIINVIKLF